MVFLEAWMPAREVGSLDVVPSAANSLPHHSNICCAPIRPDQAPPTACEYRGDFCVCHDDVPELVE